MFPNKEILDVLSRAKPLSDKEWLIILEATAKELKSRTKHFNLKTLGDLACVPSDLQNDRYGTTFYKELRLSKPKQFGKFNLETKGVFGYVRMPRLKKGKKVIRYAWGLTENAEWISIKIDIKCISTRGREKATKIRTKAAELKDILRAARVYPYQVWRDLVSTIEQWERDCRRSHEDAKKILEFFEQCEMFAKHSLTKGVKNPVGTFIKHLMGVRK